MAEREWQQMTEEEKQAKLASLVSTAEMCERLGLSTTELFWLMSVRALPGWLVGGVWKFDRPVVDAWVESNGGLAEVQRFIRDAIAKHRAAASAGQER